LYLFTIKKETLYIELEIKRYQYDIEIYKIKAKFGNNIIWYFKHLIIHNQKDFTFLCLCLLRRAKGKTGNKTKTEAQIFQHIFAQANGGW